MRVFFKIILFVSISSLANATDRTEKNSISFMRTNMMTELFAPTENNTSSKRTDPSNLPSTRIVSDARHSGRYDYFILFEGWVYHLTPVRILGHDYEYKGLNAEDVSDPERLNQFMQRMREKYNSQYYSLEQIKFTDLNPEIIAGWRRFIDQMNNDKERIFFGSSLALPFHENPGRILQLTDWGPTNWASVFKFIAKRGAIWGSHLLPTTSMFSLGAELSQNLYYSINKISAILQPHSLNHFWAVPLIAGISISSTAFNPNTPSDEVRSSMKKAKRIGGLVSYGFCAGAIIGLARLNILGI